MPSIPQLLKPLIIVSGVSVAVSLSPGQGMGIHDEDGLVLERGLD